LSKANHGLDVVFLWGGLIIALGYPLYFLVKSIKKYNKGKPGEILDIMLQTIILLVAMTFAGLLWGLPELIILKWPRLILPTTGFRWIELALILTFSAYIFGHEYGGKRWFYSCIGHISVIFFGLFIDRWAGIIFISLPLLLAYYFSLYNLAMITLPASNPEDKAEKWKRFIILVSYTWGIQAPMIMVNGNAWKSPETRIPGDFTWDFSDYPIPIIEKLNWRPGLILTKAHQSVAITGGTKFKRIDGPGIVFTGKLERPEQVFDLRLQTRTNEIDVVSKDGVSFKARVVTAFRMDPETWDKETYDKLRSMNAILRGADKPSYTKGSFPYSNLRVQATLGITSTKAVEGNPTIYWDQWALSVIEDQARKVISQKNLDELWRPADDKKFANALDTIASEIKENSFLIFRAKGILLIGSRVVNFHFPSDNNEQIDEISQQQLATWGSEWERKYAEILDNAQAESEHLQQEARVYAESVLLNSVAEGLQKVYDLDDSLPRYVIAMRFLSSLQDFVHQHPVEKNMRELEEKFKEWQEQFFPGQDQ
jgi:hypothetical protein